MLFKYAFKKKKLFAVFARGPKLDSFLETLAWGPKFLVLVKTSFETFQNVYLYIFYLKCFTNLQTKCKKGKCGIAGLAGGG